MLGPVTLILCAAWTVDVSFVELNGSEGTGEWLPCDQPGTVVLRTAAGERRVATRDLLSVRFPAEQARSVAGDLPMIVWDTAGSHFPAVATGATAQRLTLRTPFARELELPLDHMAAVHWTRHGSPAAEFVERARTRGSSDVMFSVKDGKVRYFEGTLEQLRPDGGRFGFRGREVDFDVSQVCGVVLAGPPVVEAAPVVCVLRDGYRITGTLTGTTLDHVRLNVWGATPVSVPLTLIDELRLASDRSIPLGTLEPARVVQSTMFDEPWPVRRDRAVGGGRLTLRGRVFEAGLGMHARTAVTYDVPDGARTLAATVGIDDAACAQGRTVFKVMAGARTLFATPELGIDDHPVAISVDITGRRRITLVAEPAELDLCAHADWAEARFVK